MVSLSPLIRWPNSLCHYSHYKATLEDLAGNVKTEYLPPALVDPIAAMKDGGYIVTHASQSDVAENDLDIRAQRYDAHGNKLGDSFIVNSQLQDEQVNSDVTGLEDGGFVVTWQSANQDGNGFGIFAQRFDADSQRVGEEFQVNSHSPSDQEKPEITSLSGGGFVIVWMSDSQDGSGQGIYLQIFDAQGNPVGGEIQVNSHTAQDQSLPTITELADGKFVVSWQSNHQNGADNNLYAKVYSAQGEVLVDEFIINSNTSGEQMLTNITSLADGGFASSWLHINQAGNAEVHVQLFSHQGTALLADELIVNQELSVNLAKPEIAGLADGSFIVTWSANSEQGNSAIFYSKYDAQGQLIFSESMVNQSEGQQSEPHTVALEGGGYLITWTESDGETLTVMSQQYAADDSKVSEASVVGDVYEHAIPTTAGEATINEVNPILVESNEDHIFVFNTATNSQAFKVNDFSLDGEHLDVLDLSDLLQDAQSSAQSLDAYLHFENRQEGTELYIASNGSFSVNTLESEKASTVIQLDAVHFDATNDHDIIQNLLDNQQLIVDHL